MGAEAAGSLVLPLAGCGGGGGEGASLAHISKPKSKLHLSDAVARELKDGSGGSQEAKREAMVKPRSGGGNAEEQRPPF